MDLPILEGPRIRIRPLQRTDAPSLQRYADDPQVARFLPFLPQPYTLAIARKQVNEAQRLKRRDQAYHFAIELKADTEAMGVIAIKNMNWQDINGEAEYWLGRKFWRQGLTTEAMQLLLGFAFRELKLWRVYAIVQEQNVGSVRLLEKCGFVREGTWRRASRVGRRWYDVYGYGMLREEFK